MIIYLWSDRMFLILFLHYHYQWKIVTLPLTVQNNTELFHRCRSKSTSFTWMKSRSALCSMKEPFCQMNCGIGRVHLFLTCQLGFSPLAIIANFFRYTFGMPSSTCLWEKYDYDIESSALVKAERAAEWATLNHETASISWIWWIINCDFIRQFSILQMEISNLET